MKKKRYRLRTALRKVSERPVKHPRVYVAVHLAIPGFWAACCLFAFQVLAGDALERNHWGLWAQTVLFIGMIVNWYVWTRILTHHMREMHDCLHEVELEHVDMTDSGEAVEEGKLGFRKMRGTVAVHEGKGRLHRVHMEWVDFLVNMQTGESEIIATSTPKLNMLVERVNDN